jgi:hypothetical protein
MSLSSRSTVLWLRIVWIAALGAVYLVILAPGGAGWVAHAIVTVAVATAGVLASPPSEKAGRTPFLPMSRPVQIGLAALLVLSSVLVTMFGGPAPVAGGPWPPTLAIVIFLYGSLWLSASRRAEAPSPDG